MKKPLSILAALVLVAIVGGAGYFLVNKKGGGDVAAGTDQIPAAHQADYVLHLETKVKASGEAEKTLLDLDGQFSQSKDEEGDYRTQWTQISKFVLADKVMPQPAIDGLLHKIMVTDQDETFAVTHYLPQDFPKELMTLQLNILNKLFVPVDIKATESFVRNEKEEAGFFSIRYSFDHKQPKTTGVSRKWVQALASTMKVDANNNTLNYVFDEGGRLIKVTGSFTLHVTDPKPTSYATEFSAVVKGSEPAPANQPKVARSSMKRVDFYGRAGAPVDSSNGDEPTMSMEESLKALDSFTDKATPSEDYHLFAALTNDLHAHPENLNKVVDKITSIKGRDEDSKRRVNMLFTVLADSGTKEGSDALADLAGPKCPDDYCKDQSLMAYNLHTNPSTGSTEKILEVAESSTDRDVASTAYLAVGAAASKLNTGTSEVTNALLADINNPEKANLKPDIIRAMGNHGNEAYLQALTQNLAAEDDTTRGAALYSLRNIPNDAVNSTLMNSLEKETELFPQKEALKALGSRNLTAEQYQAIAQKALTYQEDVQTDATRLLLYAYIQNPKAAGEALKSLKDASQFPDVKAFIDEEQKRADENAAIDQEATDNGAPPPQAAPAPNQTP